MVYKVLGIDSNNVFALNNKGLALFRLKRLDEAIQCSDKAIDLTLHMQMLGTIESCYMVKKGEINEALRTLEEAIGLDPMYMESAKTDKDFDPIRNDVRFKKLIGV